MKINMLRWPFCLGLVIAPSSLAAKIRGSAAQNEIVLAAVENIRHLMLSRKEVSSILAAKLSEPESNTSEVVREKRKRKSRLDKLEKNHEELKALLASIIQKLEPPETSSEISTNQDRVLEDPP